MLPTTLNMRVYNKHALAILVLILNSNFQKWHVWLLEMSIFISVNTGN